MDIKDSIRKRVTERMQIKESNLYDSSTQPNLYELENFLRKAGYRLVDVIEHQGYDIPELIIEPVKNSYLYPEISHDIKENLFYAKIVEHGMLVASDIEEIIKGYDTALGVLRHLESLDLSKLELNPSEDEE